MSTKDILKKSFLQSITSADITPQEIFLVLAIATVLSLYIYFIYRVLTRKTFYNKTFNISLAALALITAGIILTIQSSIVVSLGMVGALSIVRFRTAIKDPLDLLYLFWAITTGITSGAGMYLLVFVTAIVMIGMLILFYNKQQKGRIYIAVIHYIGDEAGDNIIRALGKMKYFVKSKTVRKGKTEIAIEVYCKDNDMFFLEKIRDVEGVEDATLIQYNGEYHG